MGISWSFFLFSGADLSTDQKKKTKAHRIGLKFKKPLF